MISEVSVKNFKSLRDVRVKLERFTVFVGANASGKSSILQALDGMCRVLQTRQNSQVPTDPALANGSSRGANGPTSLAAKLSDVWYRYQAHHYDVDKQIIIDSTMNQSADYDAPASGTWTGFANPSSPLPKSMVIQLEASKLAQAVISNFDPHGMDANGTGVHAALTSMVLYDPDTWQVLQADLKSIIPSIRRLRHSMVRPDKVPSLLFDTVGADSLEAHEVSEGTLFVLGLLTILHSPKRPNIILFDDLDRGLHPKAQRNLVELLRRFMDTSPDLQIIATTHSPYLLDCMEPNEVRMMCLRADGSTVCDSIESHPEFPTWKDEMYPGELWSLFGEKWLLKEEAAV